MLCDVRSEGMRCPPPCRREALREVIGTFPALIFAFDSAGVFTLSEGGAGGVGARAGRGGRAEHRRVSPRTPRQHGGDRLGHAAGDLLLMAIGARLRECLRAGDTVARLGGDEFTILLEDSPAETELAALAGRIAATVARPVFLGAAEGRVSPSIGIARGTGGQDDPQALLAADKAMYRAKGAGRGLLGLRHRRGVRRALVGREARLVVHWCAVSRRVSEARGVMPTGRRPSPPPAAGDTRPTGGSRRAPGKVPGPTA